MSETTPLAEANARLGIAASTAYALLARDQYPAKTIKVGGRYMVVTADLDDLLRPSSEEAKRSTEDPHDPDQLELDLGD